MLLQVGSVSFDRQPIADHAQTLASTIKLNLQRSLEAIGVVCHSLTNSGHAALFGFRGSQISLYLQCHIA